MPMSIILGINAYHADAAACLVIDGNLIAAAEEERFTRIKHWAGFPFLSISYCLKESGVDVQQIDHIAVNRNPKANLAQKAIYALTDRPKLRMIKDRLLNIGRLKNIKSRLAEVAGVKVDRISAIVHSIEHHRAHLASAFFVSPFDKATVVSVDGFGDFVSTMWAEGNKNSIQIIDKVSFPHSLGLFYLAITQYLGFNHYGDEYKVMGLASYGNPTQMDAMRHIVKLKPEGRFELDLDYFNHHSKGVSMIWDGGAPHIGKVYSEELENLLGPSRDQTSLIDKRHTDIAASLQQMYEDAFFHIIHTAYHQTENSALCLAGGCAMNSVANGKIFKQSPYRDLYIQAAAGDSGGALGAAFYLWHQILKNDRSFVMGHAYIGPEYSNDYIVSLIKEKKPYMEAKGCSITEYRDDDSLCSHTAKQIANGKVVGWFQGRMEWGPRALGNRSIVCDPRRPDIKEILNRKIKRRESFRPFAPSIVREAVADWFETDYDVPFMLQVFQIRSEKQGLIPAVTHVNGSGRLQTVTRSQNPRYYRLIKAFESMTGIPMVLNTSFNENEPVVCRPEEALDCFLRTDMDLVVLGNWVVESNA
jgi:carbamoyltransferase